MTKYLFIPLVILAACGESKKPAEPEIKQSTAKNEKVAEEDSVVITNTTQPKGFYVGEFKALAYSSNADKGSTTNLINISIDTISGKNIKGHSVVAGNLRPFEGTCVSDKSHITMYEVREPGTDKYDGYFELIWYKKKNVIGGTWYAYDTSLAVTKREFELSPREFSYNPNAQISCSKTLLSSDQILLNFEGEIASEDAAKFNASVVELKKEDIENMSGTDLELMRNAIYARHGYSFKNRKMRYYFDRYEADWYMPVSIDVRKDLTALEKKNIELIKRYEEHAQRYYDSYGR